MRKSRLWLWIAGVFAALIVVVIVAFIGRSSGSLQARHPLPTIPAAIALESDKNQGQPVRATQSQAAVPLVKAAKSADGIKPVDPKEATPLGQSAADSILPQKVNKPTVPAVSTIEPPMLKETRDKAPSQIVLPKAKSLEAPVLPPPNPVETTLPPSSKSQSTSVIIPLPSRK